MDGLKIYQGYESGPMEKFRWLDNFSLTKYSNRNAPLVVFGCYRNYDVEVIKRHRGQVVLVWLGADSKKRTLPELNRPNIIHVTWLLEVQKYLVEGGLDCQLIKMPVRELTPPKPITKLGDKIYTYLNSFKPEYHGKDVVENLNLKYEFIIGVGAIPIHKWLAGKADEFYSQAFIGLALSDYAGGAMSILEMGVRGIKVVTNVVQLPNCVPWKTIEDIEEAIKVESEKIGESNNGLVKEVYEQLVEVEGCFDLNKMMV